MKLQASVKGRRSGSDIEVVFSLDSTTGAIEFQVPGGKAREASATFSIDDDEFSGAKAALEAAIKPSTPSAGPGKRNGRRGAGARTAERVNPGSEEA